MRQLRSIIRVIFLESRYVAPVYGSCDSEPEITGFHGHRVDVRWFDYVASSTYV
jgi:hypothetical protein